MTEDLIITDEFKMEDVFQDPPAGRSSGKILTVTVVQVTADGVMVDVGSKEEGIIPLREFESWPKPPKPGDQLQAVIKKFPNVSWKEAQERVARESILKAKESQSPVDGTIVRQVKGGLIVNLGGLEAFMPASQVDKHPVKNLTPLIGQTIQAVIMEWPDIRKNPILSRRLFLEKIALAKKAETLKQLSVGQVYKGLVTGMTDFGAFVDIGGVDGLLRIADLSWSHVDKVSSVLKIGETIDVKVLKFDAATGKVSLGRKQLLPHPWDGIETRHPLGSTIHGKVTNLTDFGAFVEIESGVEGLIHQSEFSWTERWSKPATYLKVGQEVDVQILSIDREKERIALSLKRTGENPWQAVAQQYPRGTLVKGVVTHLSPFGAFVRLPTGVEGLLRTDDVSWTKNVQHAKDWFKEGQEVEAMVLEVSPEQERISLGLKQTKENPFETFAVGNIVTGKVLRLEDRGVVVMLDGDVEAYLPIFEISDDKKLAHPSEALTQDQEITALITRIQKKSRKIDISIKRYDKKQERLLLKKYTRSEKMTLGDVTEWDSSDSQSSSS
ncbi:MAG TPA: 30S ribosomal protein S1 [Elusimicrobiota bacterium]|nr:30S ribosomal protein S1 [Elusimicrobiota bacterium]